MNNFVPSGRNGFLYVSEFCLANKATQQQQHCKPLALISKHGPSVSTHSSAVSVRPLCLHYSRKKGVWWLGDDDDASAY